MKSGANLNTLLKTVLTDAAEDVEPTSHHTDLGSIVGDSMEDSGHSNVTDTANLEFIPTAAQRKDSFARLDATGQEAAI